ncbi:hypothetical protein ACTXT7_013067 [Hymenolepis weldensis]
MEAKTIPDVSDRPTTTFSLYSSKNSTQSPVVPPIREPEEISFVKLAQVEECKIA